MSLQLWSLDQGRYNLAGTLVQFWLSLLVSCLLACQCLANSAGWDTPHRMGSNASDNVGLWSNLPWLKNTAFQVITFPQSVSNTHAKDGFPQIPLILSTGREPSLRVGLIFTTLDPKTHTGVQQDFWAWHHAFPIFRIEPGF